MPWGGIGLYAILTLAQAGAAAPVTIPVRIDFSAPGGCADADTFYGDIVARLSRARRARPGEAAIRLVVRLTRVAGKVRGELAIAGPGGETDTRKVEGASCEEVVQVLSLTAALAIDQTSPRSPIGTAAPAAPISPSSPAASTSPASAAEPAAGGGSTPVAGRNGGSPAGGEGPVQASPTQPPSASPPPVASAPAPEPPGPPPPPEPAAEPPSPVAVAVSPAPEVGAAAGWQIDLGAAAAAGEVLASSVSAGGSVSARIVAPARAALAPSAELAISYLAGDLLGSGDALSVRATSLALTVCPGWALDLGVTFEPCARAVAGLLAASDTSVTNPRSVDRSTFGAGALLRASKRLGVGPTLEVMAGADFPFVTRRFIVTAPVMRSVGQTPAIAPFLSLGLRFPL